MRYLRAKACLGGPEVPKGQEVASEGDSFAHTLTSGLQHSDTGTHHLMMGVCSEK